MVGSGVFDRNCQTARLRTKTFHLSLEPSLYDLPFNSSSPYKKAMTDRHTDGPTNERQTDGHPNPIGPTFGLGPNKGAIMKIALDMEMEQM